MNITFNMHRFSLLIKRQWLEFGKIYLVTLGVALGVIITFYSFSLFNLLTANKGVSPYDLNFREPLFIIFGFLFITVITSSYFSHLGQKPKAIIDLMLPASSFEKFVASIFFTAFLSTLSFIAIFYLTDLAFVTKLRSTFQNFAKEETRNGVKLVVNHLAYFFVENYPRDFKSIFLIIPFFVTSFFLLGSIYFSKFHYIKTAISGMIFAGIWGLIIVNTNDLIFNGRIPKEQTFVNLGKGEMELGIFLLILILTVIFWAITYIRLKEKEV